MSISETPSKFWRFPEIANEVAKKKHGELWSSYADYYLGALIGDFWHGDLPDVFPEIYGTNKPEPITREVAWRSLGAAKPPALRVHIDELPNFDELAKVKLKDYGIDIHQTVLVQLSLGEADAREWIREQFKAKRPPRPGGLEELTPAKFEEVVAWFIGTFIDEHKDDTPNPTRRTSFRAAQDQFPNLRIDRERDWRDDIWKNNALPSWKKSGMRKKK